MTDPTHLLVAPRDAGTTPRFTMAVGTYRHAAALWSSRYRSPLFQQDTDLLLRQPDIALNPIRAYMAGFAVRCL
jgi:hypothetical protein